MSDREQVLERSLRYLWNAWSEVEGSGQPEIAVFGPGVDGADEDAMRADGFHVRKAPPEIQAIVAEVVGRNR